MPIKTPRVSASAVLAGGQWDFAIPQMPANWDASAHIQHMQQQHEAQQQRQQAEVQAQNNDGKIAAQYVHDMAGGHAGEAAQIQQVRRAFQLSSTTDDLWMPGLVRATQTDIHRLPHMVHERKIAHLQVINAPPGVPIKLCRRCNQHKPLTDFYRSKANADGYDGRCKACDAVQCAERRRKKARVEVSKTCNFARAVERVLTGK